MGEQKTQRVRKAQHPLASRLLGKDLVHQQRRTLGHAPGSAAGAKLPAFAAERDQLLGVATLAAYPQEAVSEASALERRLELPFDIRRTGKPNQNASIERFNRSYREEVLDTLLFRDLDEVRELSWTWMLEYNEERDHDGLGGLTPAEAFQRARVSTLELST